MFQPMWPINDKTCTWRQYLETMISEFFMHDIYTTKNNKFKADIFGENDCVVSDHRSSYQTEVMAIICVILSTIRFTNGFCRFCKTYFLTC